MHSEIFNNIASEVKVLFHHGSEIRMAVGSVVVSDLALEAVESSRVELSQAVQAQKNNGNKDGLWGYYPRYPDQNVVGRIDLPASRSLGSELVRVFEQELGIVDTDLDFIRLSETQHISPGLHTDADARGAVYGDPEKGNRDVFKIIANLHTSEPREFRYLDLTNEELVGAGLYWDPDRYTSIEYDRIPEGLLRTYNLPARNSNTIHYLAFLANSTPHSGNDGEGGHFLAGLARYVD